MDYVEEGIVPGVSEDEATDAAESVYCAGYHDDGWDGGYPMLLVVQI